MTIETYSLVFATITLLMQVGLGIFWMAWFFSPTFRTFILSFNPQFALAKAFVLTLAALVGSLIYAEVYLLPVCPLCWYQRIFMYSQVVLLGVALYRRDFGVWIYSIALSLAGVFFAGYHYYLHFRKLIGLPELPCGDGLVPSCSEIQAINFGYITMPLMSLTIFATLITLMVILRRQTAR